LTPESPLRTADFEYHLPPELIAQEPLPDRGESRLLIVRRKQQRLAHSFFTELPSLIDPGDLLVLNTTKVRHARLLGIRPSGAPAEILLIHPGVAGSWIAMGTPGSALRPGKRIALGPEEWVETLEILEDGNRVVRFIGLSAEQAMTKHGLLPLPPYITRRPNHLDEIRYQTVYANLEGSVAAPTAGLHFTAVLLQTLTSAGVLVEGLDLQVGPGTFRPIEAEDPAQHEMHPEAYQIPVRLAGLIQQVRTANHKVWAVGTTVVRALESAAGPDGTVDPGSGETRLMITPGYRFRVVDRLLTNFHLPRSTLLMLVSAFAGQALTLTAYRYAVEARYRFYSYGDAMVII
jgi:S-adenosylmethionine:tRNA ribosyltransferase-isomerase